MIEVLYKDDDLLVCIKPAGLLSAADSSNKANMMSVLRDELRLSEIHPVHRLDKEVEGLMVFALNKLSASKLSQDASDHNRFVKQYLAVTSGTPKETEGVFEDYLFKDSSKNKVFVVKKERKGVKKAKLEYKVLATDTFKSLFEIKLYTGRTHQIRVQLSSRGMPIFGDKKYGGKPYDKMALFSYSLLFYHPKTNEQMQFTKKPTNEIFIF